MRYGLQVGLIENSMLFDNREKNRMIIALLKDIKGKKVGCFEIVFLRWEKDLVFSGKKIGKKIGILFQKKHIDNTLFQLLMVGFGITSNYLTKILF